VGRENYDIKLSDREQLLAKEDKQKIKDLAEQKKVMRMIKMGAIDILKI
jgi:hypothetical protein